MERKEGSPTRFNLCVIGSGPAGIILSLEYARLNPEKTVILIEYGQKDHNVTNSLDDSIIVDNLINHHPPYECTNKGLGGSSATWGGRCVMYDPIDFINRPILNGGCTWEMDLHEEAKSYLSQTAAYFECGGPTFSANDISTFQDSRLAEGFQEGDVTDSVLERWSMPTRFGKRYAQAIADQSNLTLLEGFEARNFILDETCNASSIIVRHVSNKQLTEIQSDTFVLAAGGQESTRLLLRNPQLFQTIGGTPGSLGKYYQGHLSGKIASVRFYGDPEKTEYGFLRDNAGVYCRRRFQFSTDLLTRKNLLNTAIWLDNPLYFDPKHRSGAMSFMYLAMLMPFLGKRLAPPAIAHSITKGKVTGVPRHIWNIIKDLPGSLLTPASIFYKRYLLKRKLPGVFLYSPTNQYALHFHAEQVPDQENRMELASDGETLHIHYGFTDADVQSVISLHDVLDKWLRENQCGELVYWYSHEELPDQVRKMSRDGLHQVGTTRIADSPERGVVNRDLKVWGTQNVYVCSSSAFPTSGQANPTFFLGVFAVRLAHHLTKFVGNEKY